MLATLFAVCPVSSELPRRSGVNVCTLLVVLVSNANDKDHIRVYIAVVCYVSVAPCMILAYVAHNKLSRIAPAHGNKSDSLQEPLV